MAGDTENLATVRCVRAPTGDREGLSARQTLAQNPPLLAF